MAVINIDVIVPSVDDVLEHFDKIKLYRSTAGIGGPFTEITDAATRATLEAGKTVYEFSDTAGATGYYYRNSYYNSSTGLESSLSEPTQGDGDPALDLVSVDDLKTNYLFGLDLTNDVGEEYPDSLYEWFIKAALSRVEIRLDARLRPYVITDEKHDFYRDDYDKYIFLQTDEHPVISVEGVRLVLPGGNVVQEFDSSWIHVDKVSGQINLIPGPGTAQSILLGATGAWLPVIYGHNRFIPQVFRIDYTAGLLTADVPPLLKDVIGKVASFGPLNIAGDLLGGAGIASQSLSIDGLSQNFNTTSSSTSAGYGARLLQYQKELKEDWGILRRYYTGMHMAVV